MTEVDDIIAHMQRFSWPDYLIFVLMLLLCIFIGIYFGFLQKSLTESDYLMGGRNMMVFPIALSLVASFISGITLLGLPTEVYSYGIQYLYVIGGIILMGFAMSYFYLPVFHNLHITSTYEYLESRFDRRLRMFGSVMFMVMNIGYLPIVIYVPALAFNQVTGVNIHIITPIVCLVCVFYTCVGGLKAVVWTDVVQIFSMVGALLIVAIKGSIDIGGAQIVWDNAMKTKRIEPPDFNINPTIRHTIWSQVIGGVIYWTQTNAVSQNMIQRYLCLPTLRAGRIALWSFVVGVLIVMFLCSYNGLLIYATYRNCDPLTTKLARQKDQLLPLYVMDIFRDLPGLSGLFIAGVFSAALSSLSTCLNSMSAVVLEDFFKPFVNRPLSETAVAWITRSVVVCVGILCVALVYIVEKMGTVLQLTMSLEAITNGPLFGVFTMGIFLPWINANSAFVGGIIGVVFMSWISLNAQLAIASGSLYFETKPMAVSNCSYYFDRAHIPDSGPHTSSSDSIFGLYRISYMWYTMLGASVTVIVALICTSILGGNDPEKVDQKLLTPAMRKFIKIQAKTKSSNQNIPKTGKLENESTL